MRRVLRPREAVKTGYPRGWASRRGSDPCQTASQHRCRRISHRDKPRPSDNFAGLFGPLKKSRWPRRLQPSRFCIAVFGDFARLREFQPATQQHLDRLPLASCRPFRDLHVLALLMLGHEGTGVVERIGNAVMGIKFGDHVVLSYESSGCCRPCRTGHPADCQRFWEANFGFGRLDRTIALRGGVRGHFFGQSSFSTHALATIHNVVKVPNSLPLELLAPLACGIQTCVCYEIAGCSCRVKRRRFRRWIGWSGRGIGRTHRQSRNDHRSGHKLSLQHILALIKRRARDRQLHQAERWITLEQIDTGRNIN